MTDWKLRQFETIVTDFLNSCQETTKIKLMARLDTLSRDGNLCERPISAPLGDGLFELRCRVGNTQARLIYYFGRNRMIIFVHALFKSGSKIGQQNLRIAKRNRDSIKAQEVIPSGFNI